MVDISYRHRQRKGSFLPLPLLWNPIQKQQFSVFGICFDINLSEELSRREFILWLYHCIKFYGRGRDILPGIRNHFKLFYSSNIEFYTHFATQLLIAFDSKRGAIGKKCLLFETLLPSNFPYCAFSGEPLPQGILIFKHTLLDIVSMVCSI